MVMLKHFTGYSSLCILSMPKLYEEDEANDMLSVIVKLDMYCPKQTKDLFEPFKQLQSHIENNAVTAMQNIIHKFKFCMNCVESVLRDLFTFGIKNDRQT